MNCKKCSASLPISKKPNKSGLCHSCYRKMASRRWEAKNLERYKQHRKEYTAKNRERLSANKTARYKSDLTFRLKETLRTRLAKAVRRNTKTGSAVLSLGCSIDELKAHISSKFQPGMSWDNYGEWHIDHIKPLDLFNLTVPEQLQQACHYTNLQPLWAIDNRKKSANYDID